MIIDNIKNASLYYNLNARLKSAFSFLTRKDLSVMEPGKYEIEGTDIFAIVQSYQTKQKDKGFWESHRKYIDIQYMISGIESIGYADISCMKTLKEYSEKDDLLVLEGNGDFLTLNQDHFAILMPQDAHMPAIVHDTPQPVKKVVVKVKI
ncbi:MAG: YhcH/YjgK/YiaL family protein [Elusimicrobia bacterium]|nr:YhcH/YjgK/YiaL family protein [Elusimicrobiota bacterium]